MTTTTTRTEKQAAPPASSPPSTLPRLRRRPAVIVLGTVMALASALGLGWMFSRSDDGVDVVVAAADVGRGETIEADDLTTAHLSPDPALSPVAAARAGELVGQRVTRPLTAGTLVTESMGTPEAVPADGVSLLPATVPAERAEGLHLEPGDRVKVVATPPEGQEPEGNPAFTEAEVAAVSPSSDTVSTVVSLLVPETDGPVLAARLASGNYYLVLDSRER